METCKECKECNTTFDTIGKTYYKIVSKDNSITILCYRHWHQNGRPEFQRKGDYDDIFCKNSYIRKYEKHKNF
jgi:hypothetical protein